MQHNNVNSRQAEVTIKLSGSGLAWHIKETTNYQQMLGGLSPQ
jgi:hypothetical protein